MRLKKLPALLLSAALFAGLLAGCGGKSAGNTPGGAESREAAETSPLAGKRVRVVIGSTSTGGDSYRIADIVTRYLEKELNFKGKLDPIGNDEALKALSTSEGNGTTIMMFHDMAYLSVLFGAASEKYSLENLTVGPRIGVNPGGCFAANASVPYNSLSEAAGWLSENPEESLLVNIEAGSSSHLQFAVWYMWVQDTFGEETARRITALAGGSTDEKRQRLWDGNADIIYADYSSCVDFTKEGVDPQLAMKIFDTCGTLENAGIISMAEDGILFEGKPFDFNKDFFMLLPKRTDKEVLEELTAAMQKICAGPEFQSEMASMGYSALTPEETGLDASREYIYAKRNTSRAIVEASPPLDSLTAGN